MAKTTKKNSKKRKQKKGKSSKKKIPKPGEGGYLTPTQLRNARKRRAKQNEKRSLEAGGDGRRGATDTGRSSAAPSYSSRDDPSLKFVRDPQGAPVVRTARQYFSSSRLVPSSSASSSQESDDKFRVRLGPTGGWRTVSKLAVRGGKGDAAIGLFRPRSHSVVSVPDCGAHHPAINGAVKVLARICNRHGIEPYDEKDGAGYLRYVALSVERCSGKVQLTLVWNSNPYSKSISDKNEQDDGKKKEEEEEEEEEGKGKDMLNKLIREVRRAGAFDGEKKKKRRRGKKGREDRDRGDDNSPTKTQQSKPSPPAAQFQLHSLWVHYNNTWKHSNAIFDVSAPASGWWHVCGPAYVEETLDLGEGQSHPIALRFPPNVFRQANIDAFANIISAIRRRLEQYNKDSGSNESSLSPCLELYGGVGTIGLNISDLVASLVSSDENPNNAACFRGSVDSSLPQDERDKVSYVPKNATDMIKDGRLSKAEILIVDPPRKGLDEPVLSALTDSDQGPKLVVYVSCGFDAFQRDCDAMLGSGRWKLEHAEGHLLFPGCDAIETLAFFVRNA